MNGLGSVEVVKGLDMSAIIIKGGKRLSANAYLALELVFFFFFITEVRSIGKLKEET